MRWLITGKDSHVGDIPAVMAIERASFEFPWSEQDFTQALRSRNIIGLVAESPGHGDLIVGYVIYELNRHRINILNLAVHPDYRHRRIGTQMIEKLARKLSMQRRTTLTADVCESNLPALKFLRDNTAAPFRATTPILRGYYAGHIKSAANLSEDAYHMEYRLPDENDLGGGFMPKNRIKLFMS